ncbi:MAG: hypothetical protein COA96_14250 [SAR86 cluster bacterium]|uniref:Uncharacterized protein n=1 Tax=SAR86 cluster bacterium TaxID=2030880 RepID=A0A2A5AT65_9GAMM|nr:MAG: hypothetical protein COA96_14250 [SAR86 cluster bacterium]
MKVLSLSNLALIAEIVSGVAVVISLIILISNLRDNTAAIRSSTYDNLVSDIAQWRQQRATNESLSNIRFKRITSGLDELTPLERWKDFDMQIALYIHFERAFLQWSEGNLTDAQWERFSSSACSLDLAPDESTNYGAVLGLSLSEDYFLYLQGCNDSIIPFRD